MGHVTSAKMASKEENLDEIKLLAAEENQASQDAFRDLDDDICMEEVYKMKNGGEEQRGEREDSEETKVYDTVQEEREEKPIVEMDVVKIEGGQEEGNKEESSSEQLHLPKVTYPGLRIPWGLLALERAGLCRCAGNVKWRRRSYKFLVLFLTFIIYTSYHLSRVSIGVVKSTWLPECRRTNVSESDSVCGSIGNTTNLTFCPAGWKPFLGAGGATTLGSLDTVFLFVYAISQFLSGIVAERTPLRYFLTIGMLGAALSTTLLGLAFFFSIHGLWYFIVVQIIGGVFQATGWPPLIAILGSWFNKSRRGFLTGLWNWHTSFGNVLGYLIPAIWATPDSWGWSFLSSALIMLAVATAVFLFLPTAPEVVGLKKPVNKKESDSHANASNASAPENVKTPAKAIPIWRAFLIPCVLEYSVSLFCSKMVSYSFLFWLPFYVRNNRIGGVCLGDYESVALAALYNVGFMIGSVLIGGLSDLITSRSVSSIVFFVLAVPSVFLYRAFGSVSLGVSGVLILMVGICVNGPYSIVSTAVAIDLGNHKSLKSSQKATASVAGIIDGTGSIGAAIGPFLVGWIYDNYGWDAVFYFLTIGFLLGALALTRIVIVDIIKGVRYFRQKYCLRWAGRTEAYSFQSLKSEHDDSTEVAAESSGQM